MTVGKPGPASGPDPGTGPPRRRLRGSATDWLSVGIAAVALLLSALSWRQSQHAQDTANAAHKREKATNVGFYWQSFLDAPRLYVVNRNSFDIKNVVITFGDGYYLNVNLVPACQVWTLAGFSVPTPEGTPYTLVFPALLHFADADDPPGRWSNGGDGVKPEKSTPLLPPALNLTTYYASHVTVAPLNACA
jgi:hypothetical protein